MTRTIAPILCALVLSILSDGRAALFAQDRALRAYCSPGVLNTAASEYDVGLFDQTIERLKPCLPNGFEERATRVGAYRLLALTYIVTDSLEQARTSVRQLVGVDRKYRPDRENDPPMFIEMVQDAKPGWYTWFYKGNTVPQWIGRTAIVGAAVGIPLLLKGKTAKSLPEPPQFPTQ